MGSFLVVFDHPLVHCLTGILDTRENVLIENLFAERSVEAFDLSVLVGFTGLDVLNRHAVRHWLLNNGFAQKLGAIVCSQHLRQSVIALQLFEDAD